MGTKAVKAGGDRLRIGPFEAVTFYGDDAAGDWTPYLRKWGLHLGPLGSVWVHHFYRGDVDRDLHDHPWPFVTFPLTSYVEEVAVYPRGRWPDTCEICEMADMERGCRFCSLSGLPNPPRIETKLVEAFRFHYRPADYQHRVIGPWIGCQIWPDAPEIAPESAKMGIWTLIWHGKKSRKWGFLKLRDGRWCWQGWFAYHHEGGKHAPCEDGDEVENFLSSLGKGPKSP
jgi:hypothetical protein